MEALELDQDRNFDSSSVTIPAHQLYSAVDRVVTLTLQRGSTIYQSTSRQNIVLISCFVSFASLMIEVSMLSHILMRG